MNKSTSHSPSRRRLLLVSVCILALSGFGFLYSVLVGDSHGLKAWLLPFGPWCAALIALRAFQTQQKNDNDVA
jgi:hypothetical protein